MTTVKDFSRVVLFSVGVTTAQTTPASNTFDGLTPGVVYNIEANVVGSAGPSDWSDPVPQMVV